MSQLDDVEYANLAEQVRRIEELVNSGQAGSSDYLLKGFLNNAKARMEVIRQDERGSEEKKEQKARESATILQLIEMEHKLNSVEKEQYAGFLESDYFTKANFEKLDGFYEKTWDKLTEEGKSQISYRVWEGVRQGEYSFDELPQNVRKKKRNVYMRSWSEPSGLQHRLPGFLSRTEPTLFANTKLEMRRQ